jgi:uncharacterized SAM-binding protein YcdF (DUF218 family)
LAPTSLRSHRRVSPARRSRPHTVRSRSRRPNWLRRSLLAAAGLAAALLAWAAIARRLAPTANSSLTRFDAIIVLGTSADADGNPTPSQLARVTEAVREYQLGVAPRLILTGGPAHNRFVEAHVMAQTAHAQGIPDSAILLEPEALDTMQNACYSTRIMQQHGWHSAEVVSSAAHLPRVGLIFSQLPLQWRTHAAPSLSPPSTAYVTAAASVETLKTLHYLLWARRTERCEP